MKCPACHAENQAEVIDSRPRDEIYRRRKCLACGHRFTTYERIHTPKRKPKKPRKALGKSVEAIATAVKDTDIVLLSHSNWIPYDPERLKIGMGIRYEFNGEKVHGTITGLSKGFFNINYGPDRLKDKPNWARRNAEILV